MPTFGFSAFLKLLSMNDRPQRTAIRTRLLPSEGGYDYHRSLRARCNRYLVDGEPMVDVLRSCSDITTAHEERSARAGLENLREWREANPGPTLAFPPKILVSPNDVFRVHFTPDFGVTLDGLTTAVHIWNTARPPLIPRMVYGALSLFPALYDGDNAPDDLAVLSLREPRLYRLSEATDHSVLGARLVTQIERIISEISEELELPVPPRDDRHPPIAPL